MKKLQGKALMVLLPSLQFFAQGDNNNQSARRYEKQFRELLPVVFATESYFADISPTGIEVIDGVTDNATAFSLKTSDIAVVVGTYNTGATIGFGSGTGSTTRFGERTEIVYANTDVPYTGTWSIHEGLDRFTVNADLDGAVADRLELQAKAQTSLLDKAAADYLAAEAGGTQALTAYTDAEVTTLFDTLAATYIDNEVVGTKVAKVNAQLYNAIVNHPLTISSKNGASNIADNNIIKFKDFEITAVPASKLPTGLAAITYVKGIGKPFLGINTARTVESEDFDGVALQGAGKYGTFVLNDNKKAIVTVTAPVVGP